MRTSANTLESMTADAEEVRDEALTDASAAQVDPQPAPSLDRDWIIRPYDGTASDENAVFYLLGTTYAYSRAGWRAGASKFAMGRSPERAPTPEERAKEKAFFDAHRFIWRWLIDHADIALAVDPEAPHIIWGWLVTSGADVIHAIGCKRSAVEAGLSVDIVRDLLGARLKRYQLCTLELPQMRAQPMGGQPRSDRIGLDRPTKWSLDPTWLLMRMHGEKAA